MLRIALIGCGYWGSNLARNLDAIGVLSDVCDVNKEAAKAFAKQYNVNCWFDYKDIPVDGLDGVVIAVPPEYHYNVARYFLCKDVHTFIEKPMTLDVCDSVELMRIADENGLVLASGHIFLYSKEIQFIKSYIESGRLGDIYSISTNRLNLGKMQASCNVIWDLAPHDISIFNYLLESTNVTSITGVAASMLGTAIEEEATLSLVYDNSVVCTMRLSWLAPRKERTLTIVGSQRMIVYDMMAENKVTIYDKGVDLVKVDKAASANYGAHLLSYRYGSVYSPYIEVEEPLRLELEDFVQAIHLGKNPVSDGIVGMEVVKILNDIDKSKEILHVRR